MSSGSERREARRFTMTLPIRVQPHGKPQSELKAQTRDVSYRGLYFLTEERFEENGEIDFVITLPQQVTQSGDVNIHCQGRVVRVEPNGNGRVGIAAKIERYEFIPVSANAA
jgi:c-di-GMP-binding flagellar brake protein YcgR